jgi:hypothetical protein
MPPRCRTCAGVRNYRTDNPLPERRHQSRVSVTAAGRISWIPFVWCLVVTVLLASALRTISWSYVDTATNISAAADTRSWREVVSDSLTKSAEYRPLLDLGTKAAYQVLGLNLWVYQGVVVLEFALILGALVLLFRPTSRPQAVAATLALTVVVGLHTSQILFLFVPLNAYAASMLIVLAVALLATTPRQRGLLEWTLLPLTLAGLLWLELAVLIVPLTAVAWWMKAPGTSWRSVIASLAALAIYMYARIGFAPSVGLGSPDTGLGFSNISTAESSALFEHARWLFWLYNVGATFATAVASEPRAGTFRLIGALLAGNVPTWMWLHVLSSVATTAVVCVGLLGIRSRPPRDRLIAAFGAVLMVGGSTLGFLYTRDRIALPVGIGYAMLVYVAMSAVFDRRSATWRAASVALVLTLGTCWSIRVGEMYVTLRDVAVDYHSEWYRPEALAAAAQNPVVARMRSMALDHPPVDTRRDPPWTYTIFERRFQP